jgi:thiol-disulfide isomerase/thioredoxin
MTAMQVHHLSTPLVVVALLLISGVDSFQAAFVRNLAPSSSSSSLSLQASSTRTSNARSTTSLFVSSPTTREEETAAAAAATAAQKVSISKTSSSSSSKEGNDGDDDGGNDKDDTGGHTLPPLLGDDGIYHITNREEYDALLQANPDQIIVLKVYAPWCRACKGLEPKFAGMVHDPKYETLPVLFADLSIQHNKAFVQQIGVLALPTIQFYIGQAVQDNFPCGPSN